MLFSYIPFENEEGKEYSVLITEMAHDRVSLVGHNKNYDQIIIKGNVDALMGKRATVRKGCLIYSVLFIHR